jgi:cysteine desulfurase
MQLKNKFKRKMTKKIIYLDNAATTQIDPKVLKEMLPFLKESYGNASSSHKLGQEARDAVENAREIIAKTIGAQAKEIYFTSGGTEANNWALQGVFEANINSGKNKIITTKIEHPSIIEVCENLKKKGAEVIYLNVDKEGFVDLNQLEKELIKEKGKNLLVSIIHGNNEIGTIQDLEKIGGVCKKYGALFHVDACQSFLKTEINVKKQGINLLTINSHKIHGPKGVGVLFINENVKIENLIFGGGQERKRRSGTENVAGIVGFASAVKLGLKEMKGNIEGMIKIRNYIIKEILKIEKTKLNGPDFNQKGKRLCNNINISFSNIEGEAIQGWLNEEGIAVSTGSACSSKKLEPSHVLLALGLSDFMANTSIRITLSKFTTQKEADIFIKKLNVIVNRLRAISPFK